MEPKKSFFSYDQGFEEIVKRYQKPLPNFLYHYSDPAGLKGIIENKTLWATHYNYTNDIEEVWYGIDLAIDEVEKRTNDLFGSTKDISDFSSSQWLKERKISPSEFLLRGLSKTLSALKSGRPFFYEYFFVSFSGLEDSLSQWRAYSSDGQGYSIGFQSAYLKNTWNMNQMTVPDTTDLLHVLYEEEVQRNQIRDIIAFDIKYFDDDINELSEKSQLSKIGHKTNYFASCILRSSLYFKHSGFREEEECRLIYCKEIKTDSTAQDCLPVNTRTTNSEIIPFVEFPLCPKDETLQLESVMVGPRNKASMIQKKPGFALEHLLKNVQNRDKQKPEILFSPTPYR